MKGTHWRVRGGLGLLLALISALHATAQAEFYYVTNYGTITITYYAGPGGPVAIPSTINGLPVTGIRTSAFAHSGVTSVTMPDSIRSIGAQAFYYCTNFNAVTLSTNLTLIEDSTFEGCQSLASIRIPSGVWSIGYSAFFGCASMTNAAIDNPSASIADYAFFGCGALRSLTLPGALPSLGLGTF